MYLKEKEYWEECFSWNSEKSIGLCAGRKNEKLSKMAEKSGIEMLRRKKMEKIRWGVLGTAGIARDCSIPGMQKAENCERYGIAGRSLKKAEDYKDMFGFEKAYEGYEALLSGPKVQAVYIPLPNNLHYEWVKKAIAAGKHVLCEKPLAPTPKQTAELFEAAKEEGGIFNGSICLPSQSFCYST